MRLFTPRTTRHRFLKTRSELRKECKRLDKTADDLTCRLIRAAGEVDAAEAERDTYGTALNQAVTRIEELEKQVRDRATLVQHNAALKAELANLKAIRPLRPASTVPAAAELAAQERTQADTVELETLDPAMVNTTSKAWRRPPVEPVQGKPHVMSLADRFGAGAVLTVVPAADAPAVSPS